MKEQKSQPSEVPPRLAEKIAYFSIRPELRVEWTAELRKKYRKTLKTRGVRAAKREAWRNARVLAIDRLTVWAAGSVVAYYIRRLFVG